MDRKEYDSIASRYDELIPDPEGMMEFYRDIARTTTGDILEIGCGTGRLSLLLGQLGHKVMACDVSPEMIRVAQRKLTNLNNPKCDVEFLVADVRELSFQRKFDLVFMPGGVFEYLLTTNDQRKALTQISRILNNRGRLIFDMITPPTLTKRRTKDARNQLVSSGDAWTYSWVKAQYDHFYQIALRRSFFEVYDASGEMTRKHCFQFVQRYSNRTEISLILELSGFKVENLFGDFDYSPFSRNSEFMIWDVCPVGQR